MMRMVMLMLMMMLVDVDDMKLLVWKTLWVMLLVLWLMVTSESLGSTGSRGTLCLGSHSAHCCHIGCAAGPEMKVSHQLPNIPDLSRF